MEFDENFTYCMRIPSGLYKDILQKLKEEPGREHYKDYYCLMVHVLNMKLYEKLKEIRRTTMNPKDWFFPMSSELMHLMFGNNYTGIIDDLVRWKIVWRSDSYVIGNADHPGKCKGMCFTSQYAKYLYHYVVSREEYFADSTGTARKFGHMQKVMVKNRFLLKRIYRYLDMVKCNQMASDATVAICHEELKHFSIDEKKAEYVVSGLVSSGAMTKKTAEAELDKVRRFNGASDDPVKLYVKRDPYGRVHTNMTNMKKEIRRDCLSCDGEAVVDIDIKSSQGSFLCSILGMFAGEQPLNIISDPYLDTVVKRCSWIDRDKIRAEYLKYRGLVEERRLYEYFAEEVSTDFDIDRPVERKESKKEFLAMLFSPIHIDWKKHPVRAAMRRVWEQQFPWLLRCLDELKMVSYASLAHLMQKIESSFVFDHVIPDIVNEAGCHFCTIHDSIVVPERFAGQVKRIMDRDLSTCGIPTVTEEEYAVVYPEESMRRFYDAVKDEMAGNPDIFIIE